MTETRKRSPNHYTVFSGDGKRILFEKDGKEESNTFYGGDGRVLSKKYVEAGQEKTQRD
jgi:hypothetical protein